MPLPPNRPERLRPLREDDRYLDTDDASGQDEASESAREDKEDVARNGYVRTCRRPRVRGFEDCVSEERADRIESLMRGGTPMLYDDY